MVKMKVKTQTKEDNWLFCMLNILNSLCEVNLKSKYCKRYGGHSQKLRLFLLIGHFAKEQNMFIKMQEKTSSTLIDPEKIPFQSKPGSTLHNSVKQLKQSNDLTAFHIWYVQNVFGLLMGLAKHTKALLNQLCKAKHKHIPLPTKNWSPPNP